MPWQGMFRQGLSPILAIGIVAASIFTAVTNKPNLSSAEGSTLSTGKISTISELWKAGKAKADTPVLLANLTETGDTTGGAWVETHLSAATVGQVYGKLVVTREFGPSDEADAAQIASNPDAYLVAITLGFKPFTGDSEDWFWARFAPDGAFLDSTGQMPSATQLAALAEAYCSAPIPQEIATSG